MQQSFVKRVYESMTDDIIDAYVVPGVENAFAEGSHCMNLYEEAYEAYRRLRQRLNAGEYDPDVEIIYHSFLEYKRNCVIVCTAMVLSLDCGSRLPRA